MDTTQEEREHIRKNFHPDSPVIKAVNDADRLAAIERQVLWRTEEMPEDASVWFKDARGCRWMANRVDDIGLMHGSIVGDAPDYRPDEPGPLFLPILDSPDHP